MTIRVISTEQSPLPSLSFRPSEAPPQSVISTERSTSPACHFDRAKPLPSLSFRPSVASGEISCRDGLRHDGGAFSGVRGNVAFRSRFPRGATHRIVCPTTPDGSAEDRGIKQCDKWHLRRTWKLPFPSAQLTGGNVWRIRVTLLSTFSSGGFILEKAPAPTPRHTRSRLLRSMTSMTRVPSG